METKNKFNLLMDEVPDIAAEEAPPSQENRSEVVRLVTAKGKSFLY